MKTRTLIIAALSLLASAVSATAAPPTRLYEIFVLRYIRDDSGATIMDRGTLDATGQFKHSLFAQLPPGETIPAEAMNLNLLPFSVWPAYDALGSEALANFNLNAIAVQDANYFVVTPSAHPKLDVGALVNLSSRGTVAPGGDPLIGGFVIADHPRTVLIRGVGPTLGRLGVAHPLANPTVMLFRNSDHTAIAANDDWGRQGNAAEIETAAATVGAFALDRTSQDAALLVELPPGAYSAVLGSADATGGTALMEIYTLP